MQRHKGELNDLINASQAFFDQLRQSQMPLWVKILESRGIKVNDDVFMPKLDIIAQGKLTITVT